MKREIPTVALIVVGLLICVASFSVRGRAIQPMIPNTLHTSGTMLETLGPVNGMSQTVTYRCEALRGNCSVMILDSANRVVAYQNGGSGTYTLGISSAGTFTVLTYGSSWTVDIQQ